jgi:formate dehydrogenase major subunit
MAKFDKSKNVREARKVSRRDFLKFSAAGAAAGVGATMLDWTLVKPNPALAAEITKTSITTCPYCSVGCNMVVGVDAGNNVIDVWGDPDCPINKGKLCSKGTAAIQLVNNTRRVGVPGSIHAASDSTQTAGAEGPMMRIGNGNWQPVTWDAALTDIAQKMVQARQPESSWITGGKVTGSAAGVAFFGCSHATNEENWLYRKLVANFGTSNVEHQARI